MTDEEETDLFLALEKEVQELEQDKKTEQVQIFEKKQQ